MAFLCHDDQATDVANRLVTLERAEEREHLKRLLRDAYWALEALMPRPPPPMWEQ